MVVDTKLPLHIVLQRGVSSRSIESDEGSTIATTTARKRRPGRQVRFTDTPTSKFVVKVVYIPTRRELKTADMYYSRQELRKMWNKARKNADHVLDSQTTIAKSIDKVFEAAAPAIESTTSSTSSSSYQGLSDLYESSSRGLERLISDHMTEQRKAAVKRILEVQANTKDAEKRSSLMRMRSMLVSRKARLFAERLAVADRVAARQ